MCERASLRRICQGIRMKSLRWTGLPMGTEWEAVGKTRLLESGGIRVDFFFLTGGIHRCSYISRASLSGVLYVRMQDSCPNQRNSLPSIIRQTLFLLLLVLGSPAVIAAFLNSFRRRVHGRPWKVVLWSQSTQSLSCLASHSPMIIAWMACGTSEHAVKPKRWHPRKIFAPTIRES